MFIMYHIFGEICWHQNCAIIMILVLDCVHRVIMRHHVFLEHIFYIWEPFHCFQIKFGLFSWPNQVFEQYYIYIVSLILIYMTFHHHMHIIKTQATIYRSTCITLQVIYSRTMGAQHMLINKQGLFHLMLRVIVYVFLVEKIINSGILF